MLAFSRASIYNSYLSRMNYWFFILGKKKKYQMIKVPPTVVLCHRPKASSRSLWLAHIAAINSSLVNTAFGIIVLVEFPMFVVGGKEQIVSR